MCIYLNLMIFIKIIRGFLSIKRKPVTTEQLYWLNLYELPPNTNHQSDKIALIMQTQYKVFYRNSSMTLSNEEFEKVIELSEEEEQGKHYLRIRNQSDIHVNLSKIEINGHHYKNFNRTILPRSSEKVLLTSPIKNSPITLILIDDEGLFFSISKEIR
ncbi:fimbria/pilus periplasmic chaperone [Vibrio salilacus]|uniref:fimbria/pilus periplasmic chaperone n=1 Tax=Vibrio salilacus TaxID=1323749 RepID=UPI000C2B10DC